MNNSNLVNLSTSKQQFQTDTMQVPTVFFSSSDTLPKNETFELVEKLAENKNIFQHIAILSDAHPKPNIANPTGSIVASKDIIPEMLDAAPNCGMRVILTDLSEAEATPEKISELFNELHQFIPTQKIVGTKISFANVMDIFQNGSRALKNIFDLRVKNEFENTYKNGNFHLETKLPSQQDLQKAVPKSISWLAKYRLGLLGATNSHFLTLMKVSSIKNNALAELLNIKTGQYIFFMHTGSSIVGRYAASLFTQRNIKNLAQKIILSLLRMTTLKIREENLETVFRAVNNYGFANRTLITHKFDQVLEKVFTRQINLELLYDAPHVYFDQENHFGSDVIVHRNGANRAYGPQKMHAHPIFGKTGEPVLIAPFMDKFAYIGVGTDTNSETFFSANHEIGKIKEINIPNNDYQTYAEKIIREMEENKIINLVAKLELIEKLTYKL